MGDEVIRGSHALELERCLFDTVVVLRINQFEHAIRRDTNEGTLARIWVSRVVARAKNHLVLVFVFLRPPYGWPINVIGLQSLSTISVTHVVITWESITHPVWVGGER